MDDLYTNTSKAWAIISLILDLLGNSLILYGTKYHKAISLDTVSVWIIQQLSIIDIINGLLVILPIIIVLFNGWIFGNIICRFISVITIIPIVANIVLIVCLSFNKLYRCICPFRIPRTIIKKLIITLATFSLSLLLPVWLIYGISTGMLETKYSDSICLCTNHFSTTSHHWNKIIGLVLLIIVVGVQSFMLVVINMYLTLLAFWKETNQVRKMTIFAVVLITIGYLICVIPFLTYYTTRTQYDDSFSLRFVYFGMFFSSFSNPISCFFSNTRFREFVFQMVTCGRLKMSVQEYYSRNTSIKRQMIKNSNSRSL